MRAVRFTKAERAFIEQSISTCRNDKEEKLRALILAKLETADGPKQANGLAVGPLEAALVSAARGKVVPTVPGGYARASRQALLVGATVEAMGEVGNWLASQRWMTGPVTIIGVLNKWPDWYPKAHASKPVKGTTEGLGNAEAPDLGQGTSRGSKASTQGRTTQGFR